MTSRFHFISGLPRSGSTLLAGILRQNPHFHGLFTSTAPASGATGSLGGVHGGGTVTPAGTVTVGATGNGLPFSIAQPYLGVSFIIAVEGIFPSRN